MSACKKHAESPVIGYNPCPGCEVEGLRAQHGRDSAELLSLSQARDDARKERDQLKAEVERLTADNTSLRGSCAKLGAEHAGMVRQIKKLKGAKP